MVGFDLPVPSHDMMLRFMNVSLIDAAGPSARIPSRLGSGPGRELLVGAQAGTLSPGTSGKNAQEQAALAAKWEAY